MKRKTILLLLFLSWLIGGKAQNIPTIGNDGTLVINPGTEYAYTLTFTVTDGNNCSVKCSNPPASNTALDIPSKVMKNGVEYNVTSIANAAFRNCRAFSGELSIPNTITTIGDNAFKNCSNLTGSLLIPNSVTSLGKSAFDGCSSFSGELALSENITEIKDNTFDGCGFTGMLVLHEGISSIGALAFNECGFTSILCYSTTPPVAASDCFNVSTVSKLYVPEESIDIYYENTPWDEFWIDAIPEISNYEVEIKDGDNVLYTLIFNSTSNMQGLEVSLGTAPASNVKMTIPNSVSIQNSVFTFNVISIADNAFNADGCEYFIDINIPSTIKTIGSNAFAECSNAKAIKSYALNPPIAASDCFNGIDENAVIYVDTESIEKYNITPWNDFTIKSLVSNYEQEVKDGDIVLYTFVYNLTDDGSGVSIKLGQQPSSPVELIIPENITFGSDTYDVTEIADRAFYQCTNFTGDLVIPNTITKVGYAAFYDCNNFNGTLTLSDNLELIGDYAFAVYNNVMNFTGELIIPNSVTKIGNSAFQQCSGFTGDLIIPNGVTTIGDYAFFGCSGFNGTLTLPENLTSIGNSAFYQCSVFTGSLIIPDGVTSIGNSAFYQCSGFNGSLTLPENLTSIGNSAFCYCSGFTGSLIIPDGVTSIGNSAFYRCSGFNGTLTLPESLTSIGNSAFDYCSGFTGSLIIPDGVTSIGNSAFYRCSGFNGTLTLPENLTSIGNSAFYYCSGFTGSLIIPDGVTSIGNSAFYYCAFTSVLSYAITPPAAESNSFEYSWYDNNYSTVYVKLFVPEESVETYSSTSPWNIFYTITALPDFENYEIEIKDGENVLYSLVFNMLPDKSGLEVKIGQIPTTETELNIPESVDINNSGLVLNVTSIAENAFNDEAQDNTGCEMFTSINLPTSIRSIGKNAFSGCSRVNSIKSLRTTPPTTGENCFDGISNSTDIYVLYEALDRYDITPWNNFNLIGLATIKDYEYEVKDDNGNILYTLIFNTTDDYTGLEVKIGQEPTTSVGLNIPNSLYFEEHDITYNVVSIGYEAFEYCDEFNGTLTLPENLTSIGNSAFDQCSGFNGSLIIPDGVTSIGNSAFYQCSGFNGTLTLPESLTSIGNSAFYQCSGFNGSLTLPENLTSIGNSAFCYCSGFTGSLIIPDGVTSIGNSAFYHCSGFTGSLIIPDGVTSIGNSAFYNCAFTPVLSYAITPPAAESNSFKYSWYGNNSTVYAKLFVPEESVETYSSTSPWNNFNTITALPDLEDIEYRIYDENYNVLYSLILNQIGTSNNMSVRIGQKPTSNVVLEIPQDYEPIEFILDDIDITYNITTILDNAFMDETQDGEGCEMFTSIILPSTIETIGENAFSGCSGINTIKSMAVIPPSTGENCFEGISSSTDLFVPEESVDSYDKEPWNFFNIRVDILNYEYEVKDENGDVIYTLLFNLADDNSGLEVEIGQEPTTSVELNIPSSVYFEEYDVTYDVVAIADYAFWFCDFTGPLTIPNSVTAIGNCAFYYCSGFNGTLTLPENITSIGNEAFYYCSGFTGSLTIPNSVTSIGKSAFYRCSGFNGTLTLPENLTSIGNSAFYQCSGFTGSLTIPNSVTSIGNSAFYQCSGFNGTLTLSENLTAIGDYAFSNCVGFTGSLTIPNSVTSIGKSAFYECSGFNGTLTLSENLTTIGDFAFAGYNNVMNFTGELIIPNSVTKIGNTAFQKCSGFTGDLIIPNGVTTIGDYTFFRCSGFNGTLTLPENLTSIGYEAFYQCSGFTGSLILPDNLTSIGDYAFYNFSSGANTIISYAITPPIAAYYSFSNNTGTTSNVYVPSISVNDYLSQWNNIYRINIIADGMPTFTTEGEFDNIANWHVLDNGVQVSRLPEADEHVAINANMTINDGEILTVNSLGLCKDGTLTIKDGGQLIAKEIYSSITLEKDIAASIGNNLNLTTWTTISSPLKGNVEVSDINGMTTGHYDLYRYDEPSHTWQNYKNAANNGFSTFDSGRGYIYSNFNDVTLSFNGKVNTDGVKYNLTTESERLKGFHLIGNPFTHNVYLGENIFVVDYNEKQVLANGYYTLTNEGAWAATASTTDAIKPGQGILVKALEEHTLTIYGNDDEVLFSESFNNGMPAGWSIHTVYSNSYYMPYGDWFVAESYSTGYDEGYEAYDGQSAFSMSTYISGGTETYLVTPAMEIKPRSALMFKYINPCYESDYSELTVNVSNSPTGPWTEIWTTGTSATSQSQSDWREAVVDLTDYAGTGQYIAFGHLTPEDAWYGGWGVAIDNVSITCYKPNMSIENSKRSNNKQQSLISLTVNNDKYSDKAFVVFNKGIGLDKINHQNEDIPVLYVPQGDTDFAIAMMNENFKEIPINFETNVMGEYTISLQQENCEFEELYLIDKQTGTKVNILDEDYTFMSMNNDDPERFVLTKSISGNNGLDSTNNNFAYINNGDIVIFDIEGNAQINIIDALGRCVYNGKSNDATKRISASMFTTGVFIIQKIDGNGIKTQKIVIE